MILTGLFLLVVWILQVFEASRRVHTLVACVFLLSASWHGVEVGLILLWTLFVIAALLLNNGALRKVALARPILSVFRNIRPRLSATEQAALDAGDVWWDGNLFSGRPEWQRFLSLPPAAQRRGAGVHGWSGQRTLRAVG